MSKAHEHLVTLCEQNPQSRPKDEPAAAAPLSLATWLETIKKHYAGRPKVEARPRPPYQTLADSTPLSEGQKPVPADRSAHFRLLRAAGR